MAPDVPDSAEEEVAREIDLSRYDADYDRFSDPYRIYGRKPQAVMWTIQTSMNIIAVLVVGAALQYLKFMLVPLLMAYFVTFLQAPFLDLFEQRPLLCGAKVTEETKELPEKEQIKEENRFCDKTLNNMRLKLPREKRGNGSLKGCTIDLILMGKLPHGLAILATLGVSVGGIAFMLSIIAGSFATFAKEQSCLTDKEYACDLNLKPAECKGKYKNAAKEYKVCELNAGATDCDFATMTGTASKKCEYIAKEEPHDCCADFDPTARSMASRLTDMGNEFIVSLELSGVKILERNTLDYGDATTMDKYGVPVQRKNATVYQMTPGESDTASRYSKNEGKDKERSKDSDLIATINILNLWDYQPLPWKYECAYASTEEEYETIKTDYCAKKMPMFGGPNVGTPLADIMGYLSIIGALANDWILVLMLAMFIIMERPEGRTVSGDHKVMEEVEDMIKNYINLKTAISALTGILVAFFLVVSATPLGMIFGLLSFMLNFIPNVGSAVACVLPLPIIILSEQAAWQKAIALGGPTAVQLYVGNAMEPKVFGEALNLSAISILLSLVVFAFMWGLPGAVLSVPLLGVMKIVAHHTDHPQAKYFLTLIRESKEVDIEKDQFWAQIRANRKIRDDRELALMVEKEKELGSYVDEEEALD